MGCPGLSSPPDGKLVTYARPWEEYNVLELQALGIRSNLSATGTGNTGPGFMLFGDSGDPPGSGRVLPRRLQQPVNEVKAIVEADSISPVTPTALVPSAFGGRALTRLVASRGRSPRTSEVLV